MTIKYRLNIAEYPVASLVKIVADLLDSIIETNDKLINHTTVTHFHSRTVPNISVYAYLTRILRFASFSNEVLLSLLIYFDRIAELRKTKYAVNSLTVHRLLITSIVVASKFTSDVFYPNARYAKVGGIPLGELNQLELEFLFLCNFDLHVKLEDMQAYGDQLLMHAFTTQSCTHLQIITSPPLSPPLSTKRKQSPSLEEPEPKKQITLALYIEEGTVCHLDTMHDSSVTEEEQIKRKALISLCKSLMLYGAPCHRIEQALEYTSQCLLITATFVFIPGVMMVTFASELHSQTILVKCPQGFDMGKLTKVNDIIQGMTTQDIENKIHADQCLDMLEELFQSKPTWNSWFILLAHMTNSLLTAPVMFNGSMLDTALSGGLGLVTGLLILLSERYTAYCNIVEISITILISFVARALDQWVCFTGVILSATSILLPGYTLTMSIMELSARHVITGTIRFVYAMVYSLFIGYGLEIGTSLYDAMDKRSVPTEFGVCSGSVPSWLYTLLFPFMAISLSIHLGANIDQWPSMICCSAIGFGVSVITSKVIPNFQIVGTISAFSVGLFGNLYFKVTGDLALIPLSCGITSLVPGSIGVRSAYLLIRQDDQGISFATQMVVSSLGISVGLFAATLAISPNEKKRVAYLSY
ncbi:cyclin-domain-containing protein [Gilbertella persicaria]|uniref:Threonine/serine exporter-like N-terminal domain-containing protein n=1 Tax=Rhizopus stolonifer TaxID=4846 RepID=A0A367KK20_RHIST|nr:cyclin-domain-containing protein [Gilbertella persicaria]KAI8086834.1 cyclin-domain-containing protein [Gilbertella persicaria]RCI02508.1 hypothetical protein CU098_008991 [Rhizopus stolonifer]